MIVEIILSVGFLLAIIPLWNIVSSLEAINRVLIDSDNKVKSTQQLICDKQSSFADHFSRKIDEVREEIKLLNKSIFAQLNKMSEIKKELSYQDDLTEQDDLTDESSEKATFGSVLNEQLYEIRAHLNTINNTLLNIQDKRGS